jgi:hypothetical protein
VNCTLVTVPNRFTVTGTTTVCPVVRPVKDPEVNSTWDLAVNANTRDKIVQVIFLIILINYTVKNLNLVERR